MRKRILMRSNARCADTLQRGEEDDDDNRTKEMVKYLPVVQVSFVDHYYHFLRLGTEHRSANSPNRVPRGGMARRTQCHC